MKQLISKLMLVILTAAMMTGCGADRQRVSITAPEKTAEAETTSKPKEQTEAPEEAAPETEPPKQDSPDLPAVDWKPLYAAHINASMEVAETEFAGYPVKEDTSYYLADVDNDGIPELFFQYVEYVERFAAADEICTFDGQQVVSYKTAFMGYGSQDGFSYIPSAGLVLQEGYIQGGKCDFVYKISNGRIESVARGSHYEENYYRWQDRDVDRDTYFAKLRETYDTDQSRLLSSYEKRYSYAEIMELLGGTPAPEAPENTDRIDVDYDWLYTNLQAKYQNAIESGTGGQFLDELGYGLDNLTSADQLDYSQEDINGDGVPELLVIFAENGETLQSVHTVYYGKPVMLISTGLRTALYYCEGGIIEEYYFGGNSVYSGSIYYTIAPESDQLVEVDYVFAYYDYVDDGYFTTYFTRDSAKTPEKEISKAEAEQIRHSHSRMFFNSNVQPAADYILPDSDKRYLTESDLSGLSWESLTLARNEIYARHGRMFITPEISAYFNAQAWYHGTVPGNQFSESVFNEYEKANVNFILNYEKKTFGGSYY